MPRHSHLRPHPCDSLRFVHLSAATPAEEVSAVTAFYNRHFPQSPHRFRYKQRLYSRKSWQPVILAVWEGDTPVGLLESWVDRHRESPSRLIATLVVDPKLRNRGMATRMIQRLLVTASGPSASPALVVHFRGKNKARLEPFYRRLGFVGLSGAGNYSNGDTRWEMQTSG